MKFVTRSIVFALMLSSLDAFAHSYSEIILPDEGFTAELGVSAAYRSEALVKSNEVWVIPGTLMGGEALPSRKGISLDETFLVPSFRKGPAYGFLKLGRHLGSEELELDHVLIGYELRPGLALEMGKMAAVFTPFNGQHAMDTSFSSRRLVYDAFWGGQFTDEGLRLKTNFYGIDAGVELWKGESFPARQRDTDRSAGDVYARYSFETESFFVQAGAYYFQADSSQRDDSRYAAGHSHSGTITLDPTYFDGDVRTKGLTLISRYSFNPRTDLGFQGELSQIKQDGRLYDLTHEARFENDSVGLWGELYLSYLSETLSFRSERLKIKNDIFGAAALTLGQKLSLLNAEEDPYRQSVSYEHHFTPEFRSRIEWSKDFSTGDKKDIVTLGAVWSDTILRVNPAKD